MPREITRARSGVRRKFTVCALKARKSIYSSQAVLSTHILWWEAIKTYSGAYVESMHYIIPVRFVSGDISVKLIPSLPTLRSNHLIFFYYTQCEFVFMFASAFVIERWQIWGIKRSVCGFVRTVFNLIKISVNWVDFVDKAVRLFEATSGWTYEGMGSTKAGQVET